MCTSVACVVVCRVTCTTLQSDHEHTAPHSTPPLNYNTVQDASDAKEKRNTQIQQEGRRTTVETRLNRQN